MTAREAGPFAGRCVLLVEDDFFMAEELEATLTEQGAQVVGPAGDIDAALDLIETGQRIDAALLDLNLRGEMAYPVADALVERGIPFVFATGYDGLVIPPRYAAVPLCQKPLTLAGIVRAFAR